MSRNGSKKRATGDYEIGYARPPVAGRFKLGGVGNPNGRRKKKETVGETIREVMGMRHRIEENGKIRILTTKQLIIRKLAHDAVRGSNRAIQTLFNLLDRYEDSDETALDPADLELEDRKIIEEHLSRLREIDAGVGFPTTEDTAKPNPEDDKEGDGKDDDTSEEPDSDES